MSATDFKKMSKEMSGREGARNSLILFLLIAFLVTLGIWAYLTELDNVTRGEGRIVSAMQNQKIQASEGGVILRRFASEGAVVSEGDILFEVDPIDASSELNRYLQRDAAMEIKETRLRAEISGENPTFSSELRARAPSVAASEESLFQARKSELQGALAILDQRLLQKEQELKSSEVSVETSVNTQEFLQAEIEVMEPLVAQAIAPETRLLELRRELERTKGQGQGAVTDIARAKAGINEIQNEIQNRRDTYLSKSMSELADVVAEKAELGKIIPSLEERVGRTIIRAPVDGIINQINFLTTGGYVNQGDVMLELVPTGGQLIIDAKIKPQDISKIRVGDDVRIRLSAYDSTRYGTVDGEVIRMSPDAVKDQETSETHYIVAVKIIGTLEEEDGTEVTFIPGMTATVDVLSGKRTVLEYIWQPIARVKELALRD